MRSNIPRRREILKILLKQENKSTSEKDKPQRIHPQHEATGTSRPSKVTTRRNDIIYVVGDLLLYNIDEH